MHYVIGKCFFLYFNKILFVTYTKEEYLCTQIY